MTSVTGMPPVSVVRFTVGRSVMRRMSRLALLLVAATLPVLSQETKSAYLDKGVNDALLDLCSQKWFADGHVEKCEAAKQLNKCFVPKFAEKNAAACRAAQELMDRQNSADAELRRKQQQEEARQREEKEAQQAQAAAELKLKQQEQEATEQAAKAEEIRREQEVRAQENMPKNGKVIVEYAGQGTDGYSAVLRPVEGQDSFVIYCTATDGNQNANPYCKQLKKARTYGVASLTEESAKTYSVGPQVFGTIQIKDPSDAANAEITYAVVGGNVARRVLSDWESTERLQKRRATFVKLGLHSGQPQSQVKLLLQQQGFAPWRCVTDWGGTQCIASRKRRGSGEDEITVIFRSVTRREEDTGVAHVVGRVLAAVGYTPYGENDSIAFGPEPF